MFDETNASLKKFWDVENSGVNTNNWEILTPDEKKALKILLTSWMQDTNLKYPGGTKNLCFQTITPWHWNIRKTPSWSYWRTQKDTGLPSNDYAVSSPGVHPKVTEDEMKQVPGWLLPHFTVIHPWSRQSKSELCFTHLRNTKEFLSTTKFFQDQSFRMIWWTFFSRSDETR